jgi:hypothetical protein
LRAASGALFRKVLSPTAYGWQELSADSLPAEVNFSRPSLSTARDFVGVPDSYARNYVPFVIDLHNSWTGFLFGRDGVAYAHYSGFHGGMDFDTVIATRDHGVSWFGVWGISSFGTRPSSVQFLDARGFVAVSGHGSWTLDPIDPLTSFVISSSGDIISRSNNSGVSWTAIGQGLPGARGTPQVTLDSLGTLYARFGDDVYTRSVADHPLRVVDVRVEPEVLRRGDQAVIAARVIAWPPGSAQSLQTPDDVRVQTEPDHDWTDLRDDGVLPDVAAGDGLWTTAITVPVNRPYGFYGAIVTALTDGSVPTRSSARASYQVVPEGDAMVFSDGAGTGWLCTDAEGSSDIASAEHVHDGTAALRVDGDVTCTNVGKRLHPFSRTLELWAFSPTANTLRVEDAAVAGEDLPAGQWVRLSLPAEGLHGRPHSWHNSGPDDPEPTLITQLHFQTDAPMWLDQVGLWDSLTDDVPTVVSEPSPSPLPQATALMPAYPNPFNAATVMPFRLGQPGITKLVVLDVLGQSVRTLVDADLPAGEHRVTWDGRDDEGFALGTGLYLARLLAGGQSVAVAKILLLR